MPQMLPLSSGHPELRDLGGVVRRERAVRQSRIPSEREGAENRPRSGRDNPEKKEKPLLPHPGAVLSRPKTPPSPEPDIQRLKLALRYWNYHHLPQYPPKKCTQNKDGYPPAPARHRSPAWAELLTDQSWFKKWGGST